jgi:hypothetical protein
MTAPQAIRTLLSWADTVDATYQQLTTQAPLLGPPADATPQRIAEWWGNEVSDVDKRRYATERPDLVAGLDGLPADVRDGANRILLDRTIAATAPGERLDQLTMLRDRLGPDSYLLGFDNTGDGRAIVSRGNPDTAANVGTFVPGTKAGFGDLKLISDQASHMYDSANRGGGSNSAVITWIGYDAPNDPAAAASESYAVAANQSLDRFQQGLDTVNPGAHHTLVGHSYGSTVIGHAARDGHLPVDDIVAVGSPGMGVQAAAELRIPADRVWVVEDNQDPVADVGQLGGWHGQDPSEGSFGANQLPADPDGIRPSNPFEYSIEEHLGYFWNTPEHRQSAENIGDIIAGREPTHR